MEAEKCVQRSVGHAKSTLEKEGALVSLIVQCTLSTRYSHTAFDGLSGWVDGDYAYAKKFGELATRLMTSTFRSQSDQSLFYLG